MADQPDYKSYLLRLWLTQSPPGTVWRASLEDPHTGIRLGFASIQRLHQFLVEQTSGGTSEPEATAPPRSSNPGGTRPVKCPAEAHSADASDGFNPGGHDR